MSRSPATAGDDNFYWLPVLKSRPGPSNAFVDEAVARDLVRPIDVAKIDQHRLRHDFLQPLEVERAELLPFGDDHQRDAPSAQE